MNDDRLIPLDDEPTPPAPSADDHPLDPAIALLIDRAEAMDNHAAGEDAAAHELVEAIGRHRARADDLRRAATTMRVAAATLRAST